jgi:hypothetical protein
VFAAPLRGNRNYSIVAFVFIAVGMYLPSRCLTMSISSDFTIPVLGLHVRVNEKKKRLSEDIIDLLLATEMLNVRFLPLIRQLRAIYMHKSAVGQLRFTIVCT